MTTVGRPASRSGPRNVGQWSTSAPAARASLARRRPYQREILLQRVALLAERSALLPLAPAELDQLDVAARAQRVAQPDREPRRARARLRQAGDVEGDLQLGHGPRPMRCSDQSRTPASLARATPRRAELHGPHPRAQARAHGLAARRARPALPLQQPEPVARRVVGPGLALLAAARGAAAVRGARVERDRERHAERAGAQAPLDVLVVQEELLVERPDASPRRRARCTGRRR